VRGRRFGGECLQSRVVYRGRSTDSWGWHWWLSGWDGGLQSLVKEGSWGCGGNGWWGGLGWSAQDCLARGR